MHYAEFAEDEVSAFVRLMTSYTVRHQADGFAERRSDGCHQRLREQQVESHRAESGQARKGKRGAASVPHGSC